MEHIPPKQRKQSLFSCSTTNTSRKPCMFNLDSGTRLSCHTGNTSSGNVFPYSFSWAARRKPVTREMKQRAGEILSEALPSNSSGEEDSESENLPKGHASPNSRKGDTYPRLRGVPSHDDSTSTSLDTSPSSPKPQSVRDERDCGRPAYRGPPVLSELRGKLQEAAGHRIITHRWRHVGSATETSTRHQFAAEHSEDGSKALAFNTCEVDKDLNRRRRIRMRRRVLLLDAVASPNGIATSEGRDLGTLVHPCRADATNRAISSISSSSVFPRERRVGVCRPSRRRLKPHQQGLLTASGPLFTDAYGGITNVPLGNYCHQQQQTQLRAAWSPREQRQPNLQQQVVYRSRPHHRSYHDTQQQQQRCVCPPTSNPYSHERDASSKYTHKPTTKASRAETPPSGVGAESPSRVLVDISVIRTIVHEAAALRIACSLQSLVRKHVTSAVALLRYNNSVLDPFYRITTRQKTHQANREQPEQTPHCVLNTTALSTRVAYASEATPLHTIECKAGAGPAVVSHKLPKQFISPSCSCCGSGPFPCSMPPVGLGRAAQSNDQWRRVGARLLVHELRVLLVVPTIRLAWNQLKHLQEEQRLSRYVSHSYKSLKVTSRWAATFTRAAASKIILRVAELALQRCTLRALLLLRATPHPPQPKQRAAGCCAHGPRGLLEGCAVEEAHRTAVFSVKNDSYRCAAPPIVGRKSFTRSSLSDNLLHRPAAAASTSSGGDMRRTQAAGLTKECAERQSSGRETKRPPRSMADDTGAPPFSAEVTEQPRSTVNCIRLQRSAAEALVSSRSRVNVDSTQSTQSDSRMRDRERVNGAADRPVSLRESRENGTGWSRASDGLVHKVPYAVRAPPCTIPAVSGSIAQPAEPEGPEDENGRTIVVCTTLRTRNTGFHVQEERPNVIIGRTSPASCVHPNAVVKSMPSASIALPVDEVATSPAPFTQDNVKVAGCKD